jgi:hypothetical protein
VACISVLFYPGEALPALKEAAQAGLLAPLGLLFVAFSRRPSPVLPRHPAGPSCSPAQSSCSALADPWTGL